MIAREAPLGHRYAGWIARSEDYPPKDGPYQDYTYFRPATLETIQDCWRRSLALLRAGRAPDNLILYAHWPFCLSRCSYCFCSMTVPRGRERVSRYLESLLLELEAFRPLFRGFALSAVYIGGGTPTYARAEELDRLLGAIRAGYALKPGAEVYVEASPATLTEERLAVLLRHGVNRITLGVQSRDLAVLRRAGRAGQDAAAVERAWRLLAGAPVLTDIDLMLGLPGQGRLSFLRDLRWAIRSGAQAIHINSFDPRRQTAFVRAGGRLPAAYWREIELSLRLAEAALRESGYRMSRFDPQARGGSRAEKILSDDPFEPSSVLAVGEHGKAHAFGAAWYQHPPVTETGPRRARIPPFQYLPSSIEEEMRCYAIRSLCLHERVSLPAFSAAFGREPDSAPGLSRALRELEAWGVLRGSPRELRLLATAPADRLVWLKHLYSPGVRGAFSRRHARGLRGFRAAFAREPARLEAELALRAEARGFHRIYYRGEEGPTRAASS